MKTVIANGMDVSTYQKTINWSLVKGNVDFVMIRCAFRGYGSSGKIKYDAQYEANVKGCVENGIPFGLYIFSTAKTEAEAIEEADVLIAEARKYGATYPLIFDYEGYGKEKYRNHIVDGHVNNKEDRTRFMRAFGNRVEEAGFTTMMYGSKGYIKSKFDLDALPWPIWLACYPGQNYVKNHPDYFPALGDKYIPRVRMWQWANDGKIPGINARVDLNKLYDISSAPVPAVEEVKRVNVSLPVLKKGVKCPEAKTAQRLLKSMGYKGSDGKDLSIDGSFGANSVFALKAFQTDNGLEADGSCGTATWSKLLEITV